MGHNFLSAKIARGAERGLVGRRWLPGLALIAALGAAGWFGAQLVAPSPLGLAGGALVIAERHEVNGQTLMKAIDLRTGEDRAFLSAFRSPCPDFTHSQLSPDGRWVAMDAPVGMVMVVDTVGHVRLSSVADSPDGQVRVEGLHWAPDSRSLYYGAGFARTFEVRKLTRVADPGSEAGEALVSTTVLTKTITNLDLRWPHLVGVYEPMSYAALVLGPKHGDASSGDVLEIHDLSRAQSPATAVYDLRWIGGEQADGPAFVTGMSPDGRWLAASFGTPEDPRHSRILLWDLATMRQQEVTTIKREDVQPASFVWSPNSDRVGWTELVPTVGTFGVGALELQDGAWAPIQLPDAAEGEILLAFSPEGGSILFSKHVCELADGACTPLPEQVGTLLSGTSVVETLWAPDLLTPTQIVTPPTADPNAMEPHPGPTLTLLPSGTPTATAMSALSPLPVGDLLPPGRYSAITVDGDLAYVVVDDRLAVLNVADPENPTMIGESGALAGFPDYSDFPRALEMDVVRNHVYIRPMGGAAASYVVDVSDPTSPRATDLVVQGLPAPSTLATNHLSGDADHLFADAEGGSLTDEEGLHVRVRPRVFHVDADGSLAQMGLELQDVLALAPYKDRLFGFSEARLLAGDLADLSAGPGTAIPEPITVVQHDLWRPGRSLGGQLLTSGTKLWGMIGDIPAVPGTDHQTVRIFLFDLEDPDKPTRKGTWSVDANVTAMAASADLLFVASYPGTFPSFAEPAPKSSLWMIDSHETAKRVEPLEIFGVPDRLFVGLAYAHGYLYLTDDHELRVFDVRDLSHARLVVPAFQGFNRGP